MTSDVTFSDSGFAFRCDGVLIDVHTEVGKGLARVVVTETLEQEEQDMEGSDS